MSDVDCIVVGAGVIGLAVARALVRDGRDVVVLDSERRAGVHTSSRNSEVIHAGFHYPPQSLKARLCVRGRDLLYGYCVERGIDHRRCGKLTVASRRQLPALRKIAKNALDSGVLDLEWLDAGQVHALEPALSCAAALWSPSTGIVDSHALMQALLADIEGLGAAVSFGCTVSALRPGPQGVEVLIDEESAPVVRARMIINCAGLRAHRVAQSIQGFPARHIPKISYAKGSYFSLSGPSPFSRLVYPVPTSGGHLGIHMTLDLKGRARFGPDTEWVDEIDYRVDPNRSKGFHDAIVRYWPQCDARRLEPAYAGIRPKISGAGYATRDFCISGPKDHGVAGIVNLFGIESPGLTASLAIADYVAGLPG